VVFNPFGNTQAYTFSNRRLDNKFNIFEGITRNWFFIGINIITICGQVIIVFVGSSALSTVRLDSTQWGISLLLGALSLPIAMLIRLIPDDFIRKLYPTNILGKSQAPPPPRAFRDNRFEWNDTIKDVRDELTFFKHIHGGRFGAIRHTLQRARSPRHSLARSRSNSALGPASVMAGIIAGSIAGWSPIERDAADDENTRLLS
jgi:Ca2+-transporting ATPase